MTDLTLDEKLNCAEMRAREIECEKHFFKEAQPFFPLGFSVGYRNPGHWDIYAPQVPGKDAAWLTAHGPGSSINSATLDDIEKVKSWRPNERAFCIRPILWDTPDGVGVDITPVHEWGRLISAYMYRGGEVPQVLCDWPSDAMDLCRLLMTGPGQAVDMLNQTHITILRHIDVYPTTLAGAVQHNAIWDALAIRQLMLETEVKREKPDPIQSLGRPIKHDPETHAAIQRLGEEFHKTRLQHMVPVDPTDLSLALKALGYYG